MWTPEDRALVGDYGCGQALSEDHYRLLERLIPPPKPGGRPRTTDMRRTLDGLFYVVRTGCRWCHLPPPPAFPPWRTVYVAARQAPHHRHRGPRRFRRRSLPVCPTPTVLVVADWAFRKGHTYGAVLIDLERRQRVTLLHDREADTLATWLEEHPKVEIVAWDRAGTYAEGARRGALRAEQVADRFHLVQNLAAMLETVFTTHVAELHAVEQATLDADLGQAIRPGPSHREAPKQAKADERRERRLAKFLRLTKSS